MENDFKPYVSPEKNEPEITVISVIMGVLLSIIFGAANAYLGLRVGLTVSASIPAAVISMGVIRIVMRRKSLLENNIVQTIGSAGESLAAGAIFTLPTLFIWASDGKTAKPDLLEITLIALIGGLLGVFFMVPLRNLLIVKEHQRLPYPEGTACAKVLLSGDNTSGGATTVFKGFAVAAIFKFIVDALKLTAGEFSIRIKGFAGEIGSQIYPAVMSVGYICGAKISSYMFAGGFVSWLVIIPLIVLFGANTTLYPANNTIGEIFSSGGASAIWSTYIRYIGAGALATGGIISLIKSLPLIFKTFLGSRSAFSHTHESSLLRTEREIKIQTVIISICLLTVGVWLIPIIPVNIFGAIIIVLFGFLFTAVSSRMVGLVGSSNNPVSGMAIATLLLATLILKFTGLVGISGMTSAIAIGSIICIVSAIAGDTSQDLKTGFLLGATPKKQQIGEIIGVVAAAITIGSTLYLLDSAWGFGSEQLAAPQATLMKVIVEGVMEGSLPWALIFIGVFIAITVSILGVPVLPFAIGSYLPIHLSACIMVGGILRLIAEKKKDNEKLVNDGILFCSGMIAGEGIVGVLLALLAVIGVDKFLDLSAFLPSNASNFLTPVLFLLIILTVYFFTCKTNRRENEKN